MRRRITLTMLDRRAPSEATRTAPGVRATAEPLPRSVALPSDVLLQTQVTMQLPRNR